MPRADAENCRGRVCWTLVACLLIARWLPIVRRLLIAAVLLLIAGAAEASGPRWVTGPPYFTAASGNPVVWYTSHPLYFTDPGDLSATVNNAAANALVAAAARVWNVPTAAMTVAYGGALAEHVSSANAYLSSNGPVFPADVESANYAAIQIAVLYDSDGSVTDMLLGGGASSPAECRQNAVTESVDSITPAGFIQHAIVVLNGRCTGSAPEQQLQMQYQLQRAFGRVLGLGWSQTNDNVFTRTPTPTANQALHWPVMHPIDIVCGAYTYQCLPQPFTLRDDDVASITSLYPYVTNYNPSLAPPAPGKMWSYVQASIIGGTATFPTGEGMQGVNLELQRMQGGWGIPEAWYDVSTVSGAVFQRNAGNPVTGVGTGIAASMGSTNLQWEGSYKFSWVPDIDPMGAQNGGMFVVLTTEAINPLYIGAYSVGPYSTGNVEPSGAPMSQIQNQNPTTPYWNSGNYLSASFPPNGAASNCNTGGDGVERAPLPVATGGWWTGVLCAHRHTAWSSFAARAGRTATLEVTALDESGLATTAKAMPLIGVWAATDPTGTLPTVATTPSAFNTITLGMTAAGVATTQAENLRFVLADARGDGRPDFAYRARVLYADTIQPAATSVNGGQITISGMGFRAGNEVTVNGVVATVASWTASTIIAMVPPESAFASNPTGPVDVKVVDLSTGGSSVMTGALSYSASVAPDEMTVVSAPSGTVAVGTAAAVPFAVRVRLGDGVTPVVGVPVTFSASANSAAVNFGACSVLPCMLRTDATGLASTAVTPTAFGAVTVQAAAMGATQAATFNAVARNVTMVQPEEFIAAGASVTWAPQVSVVQNGAPAAGATVAWTALGGMTVAPGSSVANAAGLAQIAAVTGPLAAGAQATGQACAWTNGCVSFTAQGVSASAWRLVVDSGAGQTVAVAETFAPVVVMVTDASGDPVAGAPVAVHQTVNAAAMACPARGRCPASPVLASSVTAAVSDGNGLVSVVPMQLAGVGEVTNVAVATGTQGFARSPSNRGHEDYCPIPYHIGLQLTSYTYRGESEVHRMFPCSAVAKHTNRGLTLLTALVLVTLAPVARALTQAQGAAAAVSAAIQPPSFDVISVKPNKSSIGAHGLIVTEFTADGFRGVNVPVHTLLLEAYGLHEGESFGEPAWAGSEVFDIEAKVAGPDVAAFTQLDSDQRQAMLRQILAERFGLTVHRENREIPVYALSIAKGGAKLKESAIDPAVAASARRGGGVQMSMGMIAAHECTIPYFLSMLSRQLGRSIIDRTGLAGNYDFTLRWSADTGATNAAEDAQSETLPSVFTAVQEQLGLKLESTKAPADVLVVDHLERPSEN